MSEQKLGLLGGQRIRTEPFPPYPVIGPEERKAVMRVLDEGRLSTFIAQPGEHFLGGRRIKEFERAFAEYHGVRFAVAFNSATAALHSAIVAVGVEPGQEVIVPPYTFTSTATCALMHGAIPVFADVEDETFCLDPKAAEAAISPLTHAMIPVHLFGHPAPMDELMALARKHRLKVIEDCAQAPGALYKGKKVGTMGDCGIFSFQETKNLMTGEGGMLITNDEAVAEIAQLIRNHGEAVAETMCHRTYASEILGWNYRMTEFEAALGLVQLRKLDEHNSRRRELAESLAKGLGGFQGLRPPIVRAGCTHSYYVVPFLFNERLIGIPRALFGEALRAEGIPVGCGYVKPLYLSPLYQHRRAWAFRHYHGQARYEPGLCQTAERLHVHEMVLFAVCRPPAEEKDVKDIVTAVEKVLASSKALLVYHQDRSARAKS